MRLNSLHWKYGRPGPEPQRRPGRRDALCPSPRLCRWSSLHNRETSRARSPTSTASCATSARTRTWPKQRSPGCRSICPRTATLTGSTASPRQEQPQIRAVRRRGACSSREYNRMLNLSSKDIRALVPAAAGARHRPRRERRRVALHRRRRQESTAGRERTGAAAGRSAQPRAAVGSGKRRDRALRRALSSARACRHRGRGAAHQLDRRVARCQQRGRSVRRRVRARAAAAVLVQERGQRPSRCPCINR